MIFAGNLIIVLFQTECYFVSPKRWAEEVYIFNYVMKLAVVLEYRLSD